MLFINRGDAGVASHSAGRNARNDGLRGPSRYHTITDVRSVIIVLLSLYYTQPAIQTWGLTAKTVRPREKSFINAISRFQYPAQKKNMNDVRCQEMSENTLLSFLIFAKFEFFAICGKTKGGLEKMTQFIKFETLRRT